MADGSICYRENSQLLTPSDKGSDKLYLHLWVIMPSENTMHHGKGPGAQTGSPLP